MRDYARTAVAPDGTVLEGYTATRNGTIIGRRGKPIAMGKPSNAGYQIASTVFKAYSVHAIIAATFHGANTTMVVDHIDGNKSNNRADNLRWVTSKINSLDSHNKSTKPRTPRPVRNVDTGETYRSANSAACAVGVNPGCVYYAAGGTRKTAAGYRWEFITEGEQLELDL